MKQQIFTADQLISVYGEPQNVQPVAQQSQPVKRDGGIGSGDPTKLLNATKNILPGQKVGEAIGTLAGLGITRAKEAIGVVPQGTTAQYDTTAPKPLQVVGDVAQGALTVGGLKAPVAGSSVGRIGQTSALGAGLSGSEALAQDKSGIDILKDTATGAVVGGLTQGAFEGLPILGKWIGKQAENLRKSSLRLTPTEKLKLNDKVGEIVGFLKKEGISGNPEKQFEQISKKYDFAENVVQNTLKESGKTYTRQELVDEVLKIPEQYAGEIDNPSVYTKLVKESDDLANYIKNQFGSKYGDKIPADKLNSLKRTSMKNAFNRAGDAIASESDMYIGDTLYKKLLNDVPELGSVNKTYSNIITARKVLGKALGRNELGTFGNLVALGVGGGVGSAVGGVPGAVIGTLAARPVATKVVGTAARTQYAKGAEKVSEKLLKSKGSKIPRIITKLTD